MQYKVGYRLLYKANDTDKFIKGNWYKIEDVDDMFIWVMGSWFSYKGHFSQYNIDNFFYTENEIRKLKLDEIGTKI